MIALFLGIMVYAQETVEISMGSGYADRVFFNLNDLQDQNFSGSNWDIAFYRMDNYVFATRVNDGKGISVYEASNDPDDWNSIDVSQAGSWSQLYNSDTDWLEGAFDQGSATYGWGEYNPATHHVEGTIIFVLEYGDGTYRKFFIEDFYGGYTFKYSTWTGSAWSADSTVTLSSSTNTGNMFNYYSLETNSEVAAEPILDEWDLVFTKYVTDLGGA